VEVVEQHWAVIGAEMDRKVGRLGLSEEVGEVSAKVL
jgi:hypothetical protein